MVRGPYEETHEGEPVSRIFALVAGMFFFVVGMMGLFQDPLVSGGLLHDVLAVNPAHDVIRMTIGVLSILAYATGWTRTYCAALGVILLLAGFLGFVPGATIEGMLLGFVDVNWPINVLHLLLGVAAVVTAFALGHDRRISPTY